MEFHGEVPQVPHGHSLVSRASGQNVLTEWVEGEAVDFSRMSIDHMLSLGAIVALRVPTVCTNTQGKNKIEKGGCINGITKT